MNGFRALRRGPVGDQPPNPRDILGQKMMKGGCDVETK